MERVNFKTALGFMLIISAIIIFTIGNVFIIGLVFIGGAFVYTRQWAKMDSLVYKIARQPLVPAGYCTGDVPTQVKGKIVAETGLLESPYTKTPCVFYHYIKEVYESSGDSSKWVITENRMDYKTFSIEDKSGKILVCPRNVDKLLGYESANRLTGFKLPKRKDSNYIDYNYSEIDATKFCHHLPANESTKGLFFTNQKRVRISEYGLTESQEVFVNGWVYENKGIKYIAESEYTPLIISRKNKSDYLEDFAKGDNFFFDSNFILLIGAAILFSLMPIEYSLILTGFVFVRIFYNIYNRLVELRVRCENAENQINIELKKRNDLIPNLETVVKTHAKYEKKVMNLIAKTRVDINKNLTQKQLQEFFEKDQFVQQIFMLAENNPKLMSNKLFKDFFARLTIIEDNIAYFRGFHNKTVLKYNILVSQFPFLLIAKPFGFKEKEFFTLKSEDDKKPPIINDMVDDILYKK